MSLLVTGVRLPFDKPEQEAIAQAVKLCGIEAAKADIYRVSIDARHGNITKVYSVCLEGVEGEAALVEKLGLSCVRQRAEAAPVPAPGHKQLEHQPIVVGAGPAGLFAAYILAKQGYAPLLLERGRDLQQRDRAVQTFFSGGAFDAESNIQFGEGGAGAYSDGKLTTRINDPLCETVLHTLVKYGAPESILRQAKPHIGTDILKDVVRAMRDDIIAHGGKVQFGTQVTGLREFGGKLQALCTMQGEIACERVIVATGHSARDTFAAFLRDGVCLIPKPFSVGARIEHLQSTIDTMLYGKHAGHPALPPGEYTLSYRQGNRTCYSFCMCPGGQVVAAQSQPDSIVVNGMSYHARNGCNGNSALVVSVEPTDFPDTSPLGGIAFQRQIEQAAWSGSYVAPCQRVGDFLKGVPSQDAGKVYPTYPRGVQFGSIEECLPAFVCEQLRIGLQAFGRKMHGFDDAEAILTAPETRTSSPVRMPRRENGMSTAIDGLMPCGEGAGYAGGIMSAAVDGVRAAYQIIREYAPFYE